MRLRQQLTRIPTSTYRLQMGPDFRWADLKSMAGYLWQLGVGDLYLSPVLTPQPSSTHGYDVADHSSLNAELGTPEEFASVVEGIRRRGMGIVADVVPNHMGISHSRNWRWWDVLENGPASVYARYFDIDWRPPQPELKDKVLLAILGEQYGRMLENGEIQVIHEHGLFLLSVYDKRLPLGPKSWIRILNPALALLQARIGAQSQEVLELHSIVTALRNLPGRSETDESLVQERCREKEIVKRRLGRLEDTSPDFREVLADSVRQLNGQPGEPSSFDELDALMEEQAYRLSYWRVAADEINYRRFFDVNDLAAIRVEDPKVFAEVHQLLFEWVARGWVTGLRVDHPDGLQDPAGYFCSLQRACQEAKASSPGANGNEDFYTLAEKILQGNEHLRPDWKISGTTGYDALNSLNGLFVYQPGFRQIERAYRRLSGQHLSWPEIEYECKRLILRFSLSSELNVLARWLDRLCDQHRWSRDFTFDNLRFALREVVASFPVYRTYAREAQARPDNEDRRYIHTAVEQAKRRNPTVNSSVFDTIGQIMLLEHPPGIGCDLSRDRRQFAFRVQQFTGPVMAKSLEDTGFYRYFPLASLNEVGGAPDCGGIPIRQFHVENTRRQSRWPGSMVATATHDTKRGEDTRARINVLSEMPEEWSKAVRHWHTLNAQHRTVTPQGSLPDRNEEYLLYQSLVGTWPLDGLTEEIRPHYVSRMCAYMEKALREAKVHTSWMNPNFVHDEAVRCFVDAVLDPALSPEFIASIEAFMPAVRRAGLLNSLSQVTLKLTMPGVPDTYQGGELWDFSLVDPDNRRPVDFALRARMLNALCNASTHPLELAGCVMRSLHDGRAKMMVTERLLSFRRESPELFQHGKYIPMVADGARKRQVIAFGRVLDSQACITVAGRFWRQVEAPDGPLPSTLFPNTSLRIPEAMPAGEYQDLFTGRILTLDREDPSIPLGMLFGPMPAACLRRVSA